MNSPESASSHRSEIILFGLSAALLLAVHFATGNGYGFHRDELQFLDDARHLQWGYIAFPPLTAFCGRVAIALFGISPEAFRLPAAIANAITLVLVGLTTRELGGRRWAQIFAVMAAFPAALVLSSMLQYVTFDMLAWTGMIYFLARRMRTGEERNWIGVGAAIGIGVLSKYTIAFPMVSLLAGLLLLPSERRSLRSGWFWLGVLTATVIAAPNLLWLAEHHWITLRMEHWIHLRDIRLGRGDGYFGDQLKNTLLVFPLAIAGLVSLLRSPRKWLLSAIYLGPLVLFALMRARGYYMLPGYSLLYAAGAVALERWLAKRQAWLRTAARTVVIALCLLDIAAAVWAFLPVWPVGSPAWKWQMKNNDDLANEVGWPQFVAQVAAIRDTLSPADQAHLGIDANNYGEAAALALYGPQFHLPTPISTTNDFYPRGYGAPPPETLIIVGSSLDDELRYFQSCSVVGHVVLPDGVRNEETDSHPEILVCHQLKRPWPEVWSEVQAFG